MGCHIRDSLLRGPDPTCGDGDAFIAEVGQAFAVPRGAKILGRYIDMTHTKLDAGEERIVVAHGLTHGRLPGNRNLGLRRQRVPKREPEG